MRIDQLTAGFSKGDAISNIATELRALFRSWGYGSEIYAMAQFTSARMRGECNDYREYPKPGDPRDILLFHFSIGGGLTVFFRGLECRKVLLFHNITPPKYYTGVDAGSAKRLEEGYARLASLRDHVDMAMAQSEFNKADLVAAGYREVEMVPPLLSFESLKAEPDGDIVRKYQDSFVNILFVGRVVPNKKFEDLIRTFYFYQKTVNLRCRLLLVGSYAGTDTYYSYLRGLVAELDVRDVIFTGHVEFRELLAYYRVANVFLCMSEHEGFCIPLLEAMYFEVPVIAYRSSAVPETLGGASVVVNNKRPEMVAELIHEVLTRPGLREAILRRQTRRLADFGREAVSGQLRECFERRLGLG